jgi:hypothetical protein
MQQQREQRLHELAEMLLFRLDAEGQGYTLTRDVDVSKPVRHENLTLDEVEEILSTWKLRGFHGG